MIRMTIKRSAPIFAGALALAVPSIAQQPKADPHPSCPMTMNERGDQGMGFSQEKTTHHFLLKPDGGVIAVSANDPEDTQSRDQIRMHLAHIARAFGEGKFDIPMFVHDQTPPGVPVMISKKDRISYRYEPAEAGGEVVISTSDPEALSAIYDFLRFQIREHDTGDDLQPKLR